MSGVVIYNGHRISKDAYRAICVENYLSNPSADALLNMFASLLPGDAVGTRCLVSTKMREKTINNVDGGLKQALYDLLETYAKSQYYTDMLPKERLDRSLVDQQDKEMCERFPYCIKNSYNSAYVPDT
jgi:hypothetical protein